MVDRCALWQKAPKRDKFYCQYCGMDGLKDFDTYYPFEVDHVKPESYGGTDTMDNLVSCCPTCNSLKGRKDFDSFEEAKKYIERRRKEEETRWGEYSFSYKSWLAELRK